MKHSIYLLPITALLLSHAALAVPPLPSTQSRGWVPMSPEMAEKVRAGWQKQEEAEALKKNPKAAKQQPVAAKTTQHADATDQAAAAAASQAVKIIMGADGKVQGIENPDGTVTQIMAPEEKKSYSDPYKVQPVQAAPRVYTPTATSTAPNKTNQGGLGGVGGVGKVGSPNVKTAK